MLENIDNIKNLIILIKRIYYTDKEELLVQRLLYLILLYDREHLTLTVYSRSLYNGMSSPATPNGYSSMFLLEIFFTSCKLAGTSPFELIRDVRFFFSFFNMTVHSIV